MARSIRRARQNPLHGIFVSSKAALGYLQGALQEAHRSKPCCSLRESAFEHGGSALNYRKDPQQNPGGSVPKATGTRVARRAGEVSSTVQMNTQVSLQETHQ